MGERQAHSEPGVRRIRVGDIEVGQDLPFVLIAGPCQIESREHALETAGALADIAGEREIGLIYKSSFDKANRTSAGSARGVGLRRGLDILAEVRESVGCPVITDVHESQQCAAVAEAVDVLQIPAFLCRQTDLLAAAAATRAAVHVKKGQFLAPWDMVHVVAKLEQFGAERILLGERGTSFGYNTLVSDFRGLPVMAATGWPVVFDATHSVQQPGGQGGTSGGQRGYVPVLARAALAIGIAALFLEAHQDPDAAPSDGPNMVPLRQLSRLLSIFQEFDQLAKNYPIQLSTTSA
ncbi:MAG: 3-deoxy-8-phosphooctulonate synthase [Geminicoccaceae bacterium]